MNQQPTVVHCFERLIEKNNQALGANNTIGFKNRAHKKVIEDLLTHFGEASPLTDVGQLTGRKGYGTSTMKRITEIIATGTLKELEHTSAEDPTATQVRELMTVTGIGPVKAKKVVALGGTLPLLREAAQNDQDALTSYKLTAHQLMGLKYYDDLQHRIPRDVIERFNTLLQAECKKQNLPCHAVICGSFRRGKMDSGDIDILLTRDDWAENKQAEACMQVVLQHLEHIDVLVDHLTSPTKCKTKYMGFLRVPDYAYACRVDIRAVIHKQYIPALAYFTGSGEENVRLRGIALKKKMKLNEYSLLNMATGEDVVLRGEEELYQTLGQAYVAPTDR